MELSIASNEHISASEQRDTPQRLAILLGDWRAGFLPITNLEKNQALSTLDYIHNPQHPGGVHDQLSEIFDNQKNNALRRGDSRAYGVRQGEIAVQSVLFEYADHYNGMDNTVHTLGVLAGRITGFRDRAATLADVAEQHGGDTTGMPELIRTLDIAAVKDRRSRLKFDPLQTREVRFSKPDVHGKNKIIQSCYVDPLDTAHEAHIAMAIDNFTVADAQRMVPRSQKNAANGRRFWGNVLSLGYLEYQPKADKARATTNL